MSLFTVGGFTVLVLQIGRLQIGDDRLSYLTRETGL